MNFASAEKAASKKGKRQRKKEEGEKGRERETHAMIGPSSIQCHIESKGEFEFTVSLASKKGLNHECQDKKRIIVNQAEVQGEIERKKVVDRRKRGEEEEEENQGRKWDKSRVVVVVVVVVVAKE